jgi:hypothetical protein
LHSVLSSKDCLMEMFFLEGWRCRAKCSGGLPRWLYLQPLSLYVHSCMAGLAIVLLIFQKAAMFLQVCLVWRYHHCRPEWLLWHYCWQLSHEFLNKETGHPKEPLAFMPLLQHHFCPGVMCTGMLFTSHFHVERILVKKCLTYPGWNLKITLSVLKAFTVVIVYVGSCSLLLLEVQSIECSAALVSWIHWLPSSLCRSQLIPQKPGIGIDGTT